MAPCGSHLHSGFWILTRWKPAMASPGSFKSNNGTNHVGTWTRLPIQRPDCKSGLLGDIAMALTANGKRFCKVVHTENGRTMTRRIHTMMVQAADGRLHHLNGADLPDSISLYTGDSYCGAHAAEVLLSPRNVISFPLVLPKPTIRLGKRDAFFLLFGMFSFWLVASLAEEVARTFAG